MSKKVVITDPRGVSLRGTLVPTGTVLDHEPAFRTWLSTGQAQFVDQVQPAAEPAASVPGSAEPAAAPKRPAKS